MMLMKEIEDNTNRWEDIIFLDQEAIIVKMTKSPKAIYRFNTIPIKLTMVFFMELEQKIFLICMEIKDPEQLKQS